MLLLMLLLLSRALSAQRRLSLIRQRVPHKVVKVEVVQQLPTELRVEVDVPQLKERSDDVGEEL